MISILQNSAAGYLSAVLGIATVTAILAPFHDQLSNTTVALALLLVVLFVATGWGSWPAFLASLLGMLCFNFFFLPPLYTFTIADPQNWVALTAFFIAAITAGKLSELAKRRAAEAEAARKETRLRSAYNRSLLEASLDPLVTIGSDGKINDVNSAIETVTGRSRVELIGTDFSTYFTESEKARAGYQHVLREGFVRDYALELRHRDGHITSVLYNASLYRDDSGKVIGVVAAARSISTSAGKPVSALSDPSVVRGLNRFVSFTSLFSVAVGLLGLIGWTFGIAVLKSVIPGQVIIKPNAAVCLVLIGLSLWLLRKKDDRPFPSLKKLGGQLLATIVALVGLLCLTEHIFGWDWGIDQLLFLDENPWEAFGSVRPGLIAPITALDFLLLGLALILLDWTISLRSRRYWPTQFLALLAGIGSMVGLLDFVLGSYISYTHIALQTAVTLFLLSCGLVCARTERGMAALLASSSVGGTLTRRLLPAAVIIPLVIGMLAWKAYAAGLFSEWGSGALMTVVMMVLLGSLTVWNGYIIDRSDSQRRKAEGSLRRREEELREAQRLARVGSWWWDPKADSVTWSEGLYRIAGRDPKLPPPGYKEQSRFYTAESFAPLEAAVEKAIQTGTPYELELEMVRADGAIRSVTSRGEAERDADGQVVLVRGTVHDVTEHKRAQRALRLSEERYRLLTVATAQIVWIINANGEVDSDMPMWRDFTGMTVDEIKGWGWINSLHPDDRERTAKIWGNAVKNRSLYDTEYRIRRHDGEYRYVSVRGVPVLEADGSIREWIGTCTDISERKQAEEALRETEKREEAQKREIDIGFKIQKMLLLDEPPKDIPGLRVAALTIPSQRIDGDFYDFFTHENQCLDVIVADVMGKGIPAALLGAATKSHFIEALGHLMALSKHSKLPEPKEIVTLAHADMVQHLIELESFVTLCYARLDLNTRTLDLVDCGHTGIIHLHSKTGLCEMVHGDNLPLGIREGEIYDQISVAFEPGDMLLFYSDGVTEARNAAGELYGVERLAERVRLTGALEPEALVEAILKAVRDFAASDQLTDDLTCVAIKVEERQHPLARAEIELRSDLTELSRAREFVRTFCHHLPGAPLDEDSVAEFELAVNEAASNIMKHAYHGRADQWIHLEAEAFPGQVVIRLHHIGDPLDPSAAPPPAFDGSRESGFGLYLITQSVDDVRYYRDERGRNCIALIKVCTS